MKCKNCEEKEAIKYSKWSNGEFCSKECARAYSTKNKRKDINVRVSKVLKGKYERGELVSHFESDVIKAKIQATRVKTNKKKIEEYLKTGIYVPYKLGKHKIKELKFSMAKYVCEKCGQDHNWNGKYLQHQLHHIDGNDNNWNWDNLQCLCPNCHTQTDNYANKSENYIDDIFKFMRVEQENKMDTLP